jgi:serine/threonine protein kinase
MEAAGRIDKVRYEDLQKLFPEKMLIIPFQTVTSEMRSIGRGGFGEVYESYYKDNEQNKVAIKILHVNINSLADKTHLVSHEREVKILEFLRECNHPLLLKFIDSFRGKNGKAFIVTEYAPLGSLQ